MSEQLAQSGARDRGRDRNGDELPRGVFERPTGSKIYWIRYADSSGYIRREKVGPRISVAVTLYQKRKTEAFENRKLPDLRRRDTKFSDLAADHLEYSRIHHTRHTQRNDAHRMAKLLREFRDWNIESITPQDMVRFLGSNLKWTPATRNRFRALLSKCFSLAVRNGHIKENPVAKVERFNENNARVRFLDPKEEKRLRQTIAELSPEHDAEVTLALNTGMRRGEQYALKWTAVDFKRKILTIEDSKSHRKRHISLNNQSLGAIRQLKARAMKAGSEYVVPSSESAREGNYPKWFEAAVRRAKIRNFHWHDLRHTFASRSVMAGTDLRTVQVLLGHATMTMTERYSHLSSPHLQEAAQRLERYAQKSATDTPGGTDGQGEAGAGTHRQSG